MIGCALTKPAKMMKILVAILIAHALGAAAEEIPPVELKAYVDKAIATTNDTVTLNLDLITDKEYAELDAPEIGDKIEGLRVIDFGQHPAQTDSLGKITRGRFVKLRGDVSGSYILPAFSMSYTNKEGQKVDLTSAEIFIELKAPDAPKEGEQKDIRPLKALAPIARNWQPWIIFGLILLGLGLAMLGIWYWRRQRQNRPEELPDPYEVAMQGLEGLNTAENEAKMREFYFQLSEILRNYVEATFGFPASDRTLEEIKNQLPDVAQLSPEARGELLLILEESELVKFADATKNADDAAATLKNARNFLMKTKVTPQISAEDSVV